MARGLVVVLALTACGPSGGKDGECKDSLTVGDLVITEVFADFKAPAGGTGADEGKEWFEIYNASDRPLELEGLRVDHSRPNGDGLKSHVLDAVTIAPGQYFTLGNATADLVPAYIDYGYSADLGDFFNNDGGRIVLSCGDSEIDASDYEAVEQGRSRQLTGATFPDYTLNDDLANWCEAADAEFEEGNLGTPGSENDCTPLIIGACNDNGTMRDTVPPQPGELVITEVMPNPRTGMDSDTEWFEAKALANFDLNGLTLDRAGDAGDSDTIESPDCIAVTAGEYVVFAHNTDMGLNNLPTGVVVKATFGFAVVSSSATAPPDVTISSGGTIIDTVTWSSAPTGASITLDPAFEDDALANDTESNFCDGTSVYFAGATGAPTDDELGTPGAANDSCPVVVPPGSCDDGVTVRTIVPPTAGDLVITEIMPRPAVNNAGGAEWFEITNIGGASFDLVGLGLDRAADTRAPDVIGGSACLSVAPGAFVVVARSSLAANNGGIPVTVTATFGMNMVDNDGNVQVVDPTTCAVATPFECTTIFDRVDWGTTTATPGLGVSAQLRDDQFTTTANDLAPTNYCAGTVAYGTGGAGTPGAADPLCPP